MSRKGACATSSGIEHLLDGPLGPELLGLVGVEREEHRSRIRDREGRRVVGGAHRSRVGSRDEDSTHRASWQLELVFRCEQRDVGHHDSRLSEQAQLHGELGTPDCARERAPAEELGDDQGDEARLTAWQRPQVLDDRFDAPVLRRHDLEVRLHPRELSEPRKDPRIAVPAGNVDRLEVVARDQPRVPDRFLKGSVVRLDVEHDAIRRGRRGGDRRHSGSQATRDLAVVPTDAVEAEDEERDRDRHRPRALRELRLRRR